MEGQGMLTEVAVPVGARAYLQWPEPGPEPGHYECLQWLVFSGRSLGSANMRSVAGAWTRAWTYDHVCLQWLVFSGRSLRI